MSEKLREEDWGALCRAWDPVAERTWVFADSRKGGARNGAGRGGRALARMAWAAAVLLVVALGVWWGVGGEKNPPGEPLVAEWRMGDKIQMVWVWTEAFPEGTPRTGERR